MIPLLADNAPHQGKLVHPLRHAGKLVADLDPWNVCRNRPRSGGDLLTGMRIKRLQLAGATLHPENDQAAGGLSTICRFMIPGKKFCQRR
jgi:hypothetical protein